MEFQPPRELSYLSIFRAMVCCQVIRDRWVFWKSCQTLSRRRLSNPPRLRYRVWSLNLPLAFESSSVEIPGVEFEFCLCLSLDLDFEPVFSGISIEVAGSFSYWSRSAFLFWCGRLEQFGIRFIFWIRLRVFRLFFSDVVDLSNLESDLSSEFDCVSSDFSCPPLFCSP